MNKMNLKMMLYILIGLIILGGVVVLFINLLPFILIAFLVLWGIKKFKDVREPKKWDEEEEFKAREEYYESQNSPIVDEEFDTSKAIDVDYEDVEKK